MSKIKAILLILFNIVIIMATSILLFSTIEYYDLQSFAIVGIPTMIILRFADMGIRDCITKQRHMQTLVSTFISTIILILLLVASYFIYTKVLNNVDICKLVIDSVDLNKILALFNKN